MSLPTFTAKTDGVDLVHAADVNELQNEVAPTAAAALHVRYSTSITSTATTLTDSSVPLQSIASTASATMTLPAVSTANHAFFVVNRSTANSVTVNNSSSAFVAVIRPASAGVIFPDSTAGWYGTMPTNSIGVPLYICKSTNETVNNSTVFQDDDHFTFSIAASEVWLLRFNILYNAVSSTTDINFTLSVPAGCSFYLGGAGVATAQNVWGAAAFNESPASLVVSGGTLLLGTAASTSNSYGAKLEAVVVNSTTSGTCVLQWAQATAGASNTNILANSVLEYVRVK